MFVSNYWLRELLLPAFANCFVLRSEPKRLMLLSYKICSCCYILISEGSNALKVVRKMLKIKLKGQREDGIKILPTVCIYSFSGTIFQTADTFFGATR